MFVNSKESAQWMLFMRHSSAILALHIPLQGMLLLSLEHLPSSFFERFSILRLASATD